MLELLCFRQLPATDLLRCSLVSRLWLRAASDVLGESLLSVSFVGQPDLNELVRLLEKLSSLHTLDISSISSEKADSVLRKISSLSLHTSLHTLKVPVLNRISSLVELAYCTRLAFLSISGTKVDLLMRLSAGAEVS